jgi:L-alanine-DL-glutamate epimerase-like enolase superfamily enzyme
MVVVETYAAGEVGIGYTYADLATAMLIRDELAEVVTDLDACDIPAAWLAMVRRVRNIGRPGVASMAISAVDVSLWDLKAKLLGVSVSRLLGTLHEGMPVYGSGGFTSYSDDQLREQLGGWAADGLRSVKMKVGREPDRDVHRVEVARNAIGGGVSLFVDANGGYSRKQALALALAFADCRVAWFEEPVSSDDLDGLRLIRDRAPAGMDIAAGEYGYDAFYFRRMLQAGAVDVLQADATRCGGITGFLKAAALCEAFNVPLSSHCAPTLHLAACCAANAAVHMEYFHDHERIEHMLFEGAPTPAGGVLHADVSRPGLGIELKRADAVRYAA